MKLSGKEVNKKVVKGDFFPSKITLNLKTQTLNHILLPPFPIRAEEIAHIMSASLRTFPRVRILPQFLVFFIGTAIVLVSELQCLIALLEMNSALTFYFATVMKQEEIPRVSLKVVFYGSFDPGLSTSIKLAQV